jgi:DNA-binding XRE family transcriptional regulator
MKDRIKEIMNAEKMTSAMFADTLGVGRAVISNIMTERNRPTLDVVLAILKAMPNISSKWLMTGNGNMYENGAADSTYPETMFASQSAPDLFSQNPVKPDISAKEAAERKENELNSQQNTVQPVITERIIYQERPEKKISRIIVYYSDNTFEVFDTGKLVP